MSKAPPARSSSSAACRSGAVTAPGSALSWDARRRCSFRMASGPRRSRQSRSIYDGMIRRRLDRSATLVAFGGGVVGDVAGFAAATYLRGIRLVQVPTTLLSQVDSAIGGKVGVNLPEGKNLVGSFHAPSLVVCDPDVLRTLPRREFRAGLYEVVKYGVIASRQLFERVSSSLPAIFGQDTAVLSELIADCCRIKARVVELDEREAGPRRVLNFGHTVGHALEAITKYRRFRHGEAVAYGMLAAARLSAARGMLTPDDEARLQDVIKRMGPLPPVWDSSVRPVPRGDHARQEGHRRPAALRAGAGTGCDRHRLGRRAEGVGSRDEELGNETVGQKGRGQRAEAESKPARRRRGRNSPGSSEVRPRRSFRS